MCVVLDTNRFGDALSGDPRYVPLLRWLSDPDGEGTIVFGGSRYRGEIDKHGKAREFFVQRWRAGRACSVDDSRVDAEEERLKLAGSCESDDEHVLALARVSGARVVCTEDRDLWADVKNKSLLDAPRGRIYRTAEHVSLLHHDSGCQRSPAQHEPTTRGRRRRR